ncbi:uncharacterized protein M6B38_309955 [Iris pallida]|nr:uncharacterized protein M6B38_309955 [Iris pallida]
MGFMLRVRLSSFFAGAASASVAGFYFLHKDYELAHEALSQQVREGYESLEGRCEVLSARVTALEDLKKPETTAPVEGSQ